jgi:thermitase
VRYLLRYPCTALALFAILGAGHARAAVPAPGDRPPKCVSCSHGKPSWAPPRVRGPQDGSAAGTILVRLRSGVEIQSRAGILRLGGVRLQRIGSLPCLGIDALAPPPGGSAEAALARVRQDPRVLSAQPNYIYHAIEPLTQGRHTSTRPLAQPTASPRPALLPLEPPLPGDPLLSFQWSLFSLMAPAAWSVHRGSPRTWIAIVDTGVDLGHPDLQGKIAPRLGSDWITGDGDPSDEYGHGTAVASVAAAATNNDEGIAGANPGALIYPVRVLDANGAGTSLSVASGIVEAADQPEVAVINLSLGGGPGSDAVERDAIRLALRRGKVVVAAAGNDSRLPFLPGSVNYPAAYPEAIAVAATDPEDNLAFFSSVGPEVDIAAPGVDVLHARMPTSDDPDTLYEWDSGTSLSAPLVAAAAALLKSANPLLTPAQIRQRLLSTADPCTSVGYYLDGGALDGGISLFHQGRLQVVASSLYAPNPYYGFGRLNLYRALRPQARLLSAAAPLSPPDGAQIDGPFTFIWRAVPGAVRYRLEALSRTDDDFGWVRTVIATSRTTRLTLTREEALHLPPAQMLWRVAALDPSGIPGRYSPARALRVEVPGPELLSPAAGATAAAPLTFSWSEPPHRWGIRYLLVLEQPSVPGPADGGPGDGGTATNRGIRAAGEPALRTFETDETSVTVPSLPPGRWLWHVETEMEEFGGTGTFHLGGTSFLRVLTVPG